MNTLLEINTLTFLALEQIYNTSGSLANNLVIYEQKTVNIGTGKVRVILDKITEALLISFPLSEIVEVRLRLFLRHIRQPWSSLAALEF